MARVFLIVLDSLGIGAMPDAGQFGDEGTNTLRSATGGSDAHYPNLKKMGLFNIDGVDFSKGTRETAPGLPGWISGGDPCTV